MPKTTPVPIIAGLPNGEMLPRPAWGIQLPRVWEGVRSLCSRAQHHTKLCLPAVREVPDVTEVADGFFSFLFSGLGNEHIGYLLHLMGDN